MTITQPVTAQAMNEKDPTFKHMFKAVVTAGDKVYVQATRWASEDAYKPGYSVRIYETTENALASGDLGKVIKEFTGDTGWSSSMLYDEENKAIWCGIGYDLWRYDGSAWKQYDQNALGGIISAFAAVTKEPTWANFADTSWYDGENAASGSSSDPYVMTTAEQLAGLAQLLKNKESTFEGSYFVLDSDIDLQNREWLPIGRFLNNFNNYGFAGDFDGRGHSIKGLLVTKVSNVLGETDMRTECPALFGYLASKGSIRNLYVEGVVKGNKAQGASVLVTWNTGTIDNCVVSGDVTCGRVLSLICRRHIRRCQRRSDKQLRFIRTLYNRTDWHHEIRSWFCRLCIAGCKLHIPKLRRPCGKSKRRYFAGNDRRDRGKLLLPAG